MHGELGPGRGGGWRAHGQPLWARPDAFLRGKERTRVLGAWKVTVSPVPWLPLANACKAIPGFLRTESWNSQASTRARVQVFSPVSGFTLDAFTEGPLELALPAHGHPRGEGGDIPAARGTLGKFPWLLPHFLDTNSFSFGK